MTKKTLEEKIDQFKNVLQVLADGCNQYNSTKKKHHLINIATSLRALVCTGSHNLKPALFNLADELGITLTLYAAPPRPEKPREGLIDHRYFSKSWSPFSEPPGQLYTAREWMLVSFFFVSEEKRYASRNDVVRGIADKSAAHLDDEHANSTLALAKAKGSEMDGEAFFLIDTASAVLYLGETLLRKYEIPVVLVNPENDGILQIIKKKYGELRISMGPTMVLTGKT